MIRKASAVCRTKKSWQPRDCLSASCWQTSTYLEDSIISIASAALSHIQITIEDVNRTKVIGLGNRRVCGAKLDGGVGTERCVPHADRADRAGVITGVSNCVELRAIDAYDSSRVVPAVSVLQDGRDVDMSL